MNYWQTTKTKLSQLWYKRESRRVLVGIIIGIALLAGIGVGIYRALPATEQAVTINPVSREEVNELVQVQVEAVIADLYPGCWRGGPPLWLWWSPPRCMCPPPHRV